MRSTIRTYLWDLAERVAATFGVAFGGSLVAGNWFSVEGVQDLSVPQVAALAGVTAVLSLLKGVVARAVGDRNSASLAPTVTTKARQAP